MSEMFDNPLYGSMGKSHGRGKEPSHQQTDHLTAGDPPQSSSKDSEIERPPLPTPRNRSYTCSDNKPQPPTPANLHPTVQKKPVVPSRSEGGTAPSRPPLPAKSRPEPQPHKSRDYRDISDIQNKNRAPARPAQPHKDSKELALINECYVHTGLRNTRSSDHFQRKVLNVLVKRTRSKLQVTKSFFGSTYIILERALKIKPVEL